MKKNALTLVLALASVPVWPAEAITPEMEKLVDCADLKDSLQRLECYDRGIVPFARARSAAATSASAVVVRATAPAEVPMPSTTSAPSAAPAILVSAPPASASTLGQEQLPADRKPAAPEEEQVLRAKISSLRTAGNAFLVSLDNGQVWRHEDQYQGAYLKQGESVTVRKAAMGSYRLTRDAGESRNWIRVTRVR
jgi:hypothetical protein